MKTTIKERPILMSAAMVRAVLDGSKSQTRRPVKPQPTECDWERDAKPAKCWVYQKYSRSGNIYANSFEKDWPQNIARFNPFGVVGDRLWVRETFALENTSEYHGDHKLPTDGRPVKEVDEGGLLIPHYRATNPEPNLISDDAEEFDDRTRWKPSIHMPRWASRITLEITNVRVQRIQEISEEDARAEGCYWSGRWTDSFSGIDARRRFGEEITRNKAAFAEMWESIYGSDAWDRNDWVWAISFKRIELETQ